MPEELPFDSRTPFTRRAFVAGAAAAVTATLASSGTAVAAGTTDPIYRIHPAIGVARLGNADSSQFFIGPEAPGYAPLGDAPGTTVPNYKTADGKIKPQAARFRIFEYGWIAGRLTPIREVNLGTPGVVAISWQCHLANKKASFFRFEGGQGENRPAAPLRNASVTNRRSLEIDFGARSISGGAQGPISFQPGGSGNPASENTPLNHAGQPIIAYLGELRTDNLGRLLVLGGKGKTGYSTPTPPPLPHWANNDGWFDDVADGPVTATVTINDNGTLKTIPMDSKGGAWVLCGPPDFAPGIPGSVTAYDLLLDVAVRSIPVPAENALYDAGGPLEKLRLLQDDHTPETEIEFPNYVPDFAKDIRPILVAAYNLWWIDSLVTLKHNNLISPTLGDPNPKYDAYRKKVFTYMRPPLGVPASPGTRSMPKILGDDPYIQSMPEAVQHLPLTHVQFAMLAQWAAGNFVPLGDDPPPPPEISPHGLDQAALENCVGGAFFPGIEFGWQMRNPNLFIEPFRLNLAATSGFLGEEGLPIGPGHFSRQMAVPWQADFNDCRNEGNYAWWPSQRPTHALPSATATKRVDWARPTNKFAGGNKESTHEDMVNEWYKFGFVLEQGDVFIEQERAKQIP